MSELAVIDRPGIDRLVTALRERGYTVVAPVVDSGSIMYREVESGAELATGWSDEQDGGTYRLVRRDDGALFQHNAGQSSPKRYLFPPTLQMWHGNRDELEPPSAPPRHAFIGVRACDLAAIGVQDRVFLGGSHSDRDYSARRADALIVAVNCGCAGGTCFCVSMGTGPKVEGGFDLALTELLDGGDHRFLVEVGSERGAELLAELPRRPARERDVGAAAAAVDHAAESMGRSLDTTDIKGLLYGNWEHERWDDVAERCLTCGNCTLVCPTCFCSTVDDRTDLAGDETERRRHWDSCFTLDHSYIHGGSVRRTARARYRQWMTHKLATWIDQFGTSGCVGCGRCITWCPVGIDITEEAAAIRAADSRDDR